MKAHRGHTYDPCPGCGGTPEPYRPRPKNGVCSNCRATLDAATRRREEVVQAGERTVLLYAFPTQPHWLPYLRECRPHGDEMSTQKAFWQLVMAVSSPKTVGCAYADGGRLIPTKKGRHSDFSPGRPEDYREIDSVTVQHLRLLWDEIDKSLDATYKDGQQHGTSLLMQLHSGELSMQEFEKRAKRD